MSVNEAWPDSWTTALDLAAPFVCFRRNPGSTQGRAPAGLCCVGLRNKDKVSKAPIWQDFFEERNAMILGMNPRELRIKRRWSVHLWSTGRHWALVLQPAGKVFTARIVDDFVYNAAHCFSAEVSSERFFLVYEMLVDQGEPFLSVSVKTDFQPERKQVQHLGDVGPLAFEDIKEMAAETVLAYRAYGIVGCNCQHFVMEFALSLGLPAVSSIVPDDEAMVQAAADGAAVVSAVGITVAATAAAGAAGTGLFNTVVPSAAVAATPLAAAPPVLFTVAAGAGAVGILSGFTLIFVGTGYRCIHQHYRESLEYPSGKKKSVRERSGSGDSARSSSCSSNGDLLLLTKTSAIMHAEESEESMSEVSSDEPEPEAVSAHDLD
mmetsp:Transcript_144797/g.265962  ORF Transcript_144797/g.265962 Transcript_144797/m.265962 type:complete len:378 (-) Transcript_144797:38-1171(-)